MRGDVTLVEKKGPESNLRSVPDTSIRQLGDLGLVDECQLPYL